MTSRFEKFFCLLLTALSVGCLAVLAVTSCQAQDLRMLTPDCCSQAVQLNRQNLVLQGYLTRTQSTLDSTRAVGQRIMDQTDRRIRDLSGEKQAQITLLDAKVDRLQISQLNYDAVKAERDKLKGRTWAGRVLRKSRDVLAYAGGLFVVVAVVGFLH